MKTKQLHVLNSTLYMHCTCEDGGFSKIMSHAITYIVHYDNIIIQEVSTEEP